MIRKTPTKADWPYIKRKLIEAYGVLEGIDLDYRPGHEDMLYDTLQQRLGKTRDEVIRLIESFNPDFAIAQSDSGSNQTGRQPQ